MRHLNLILSPVPSIISQLKPDFQDWSNFSGTREPVCFGFFSVDDTALATNSFTRPLTILTAVGSFLVKKWRQMECQAQLSRRLFELFLSIATFCDVLKRNAIFGRLGRLRLYRYRLFQNGAVVLLLRKTWTLSFILNYGN